MFTVAKVPIAIATTNTLLLLCICGGGGGGGVAGDVEEISPDVPMHTLLCSLE